LTGRPGVCLVVGGPGVLHAIAGVCTVHRLCLYPCSPLPNAPTSSIPDAAS
jgi:hypothetical protein